MTAVSFPKKAKARRKTADATHDRFGERGMLGFGGVHDFVSRPEDRVADQAFMLFRCRSDRKF
jgi:hypothetical protein